MTDVDSISFEEESVCDGIEKKVSANIHGSKRKGPEKKILLLT